MLENIIWILICLAGSIWFFSLIEGWSDIGPLDDDTPEDP